MLPLGCLFTWLQFQKVMWLLEGPADCVLPRRSIYIPYMCVIGGATHDVTQLLTLHQTCVGGVSCEGVEVSSTH